MSSESKHSPSASSVSYPGTPASFQHNHHHNHANSLPFAAMLSPSASNSSSIPGTPAYLHTPGTQRTAGSTQSHFSQWDRASSIMTFDSLDKSQAYVVLADQLRREARRRRLQVAGYMRGGAVPQGWDAVVLRQARGHFVASPARDPRAQAFAEEIRKVNAMAAATVSSVAVTAVLEVIPEGVHELVLSEDDKIQLVEDMTQLSTCRKGQGVALVRREQKMVVWTDAPDDLLDRAEVMQAKVMKFVRTIGEPTRAAAEADDEKRNKKKRNQSKASTFASGGLLGLLNKYTGGVVTHRDAELNSEKQQAAATTNNDIEAAKAGGEDERRNEYLAPLYCGLALGLNVFCTGLFAQDIVFTALQDRQWIMLLGLLAVPVYLCIIQFFYDNVIGVIGQLLMPVNQMKRNSTFYSGTKPQPMSPHASLPDFTVQLPVYKESLEGVLAPTIQSLNAAIAAYELKGGCANILVSEDGMQLLSEEEREERKDYYERNDVSWVARPGHNKNGYIRKGRFKKASNLNFTCAISMRVEEIMDEQRPLKRQQQGTPHASWTEADEKALYDEALEVAVKETEGKAWVSGNVRIGRYILIIDSDTRVPVDCFIDAAAELEACPEVGIIQHCSGVMYVAEHFFEKMIGFFTYVVNYSISWCVSNGAVAPFVGHNAFLRWSALQSVQYVDETDGERCIWSSSHVSEDFDMALRLLMNGYIVRWATYANSQFLEGVSLTPEDEINRWQKYAYGCSELVFNPLRYWPTRGPLTKLFRTFLFSNCLSTYKINACSYIFSYWAIAWATVLAPALTLAYGLFDPVISRFSTRLFGLWLGVFFVFSVGGNTALIVSRWRSRESSFRHAFVEHMKWFPALCIFFGGLSYHIFLALAAHIVGYDMSWSATIKDVEESNFYIEFPAMVKRFWKMFLFFFTIMAAVIVLNTGLIPFEWRIEGPLMVFPCLFFCVCHVLYPIALNPWMMRFSF